MKDNLQLVPRDHELVKVKYLQKNKTIKEHLQVVVIQMLFSSIAL